MKTQPFSFAARFLALALFALLSFSPAGSIAHAGTVPQEEFMEQEESMMRMTDDSGTKKTYKSYRSNTGFSLGFEADLSILRKSRATGNPVTIDGLDYEAFDGEVDLNTGFGLSVMLGYEFQNGLRLEGEVGWIRNGLDELDIDRPGSLLALLGINPATQMPCVAGTEGCVGYSMLDEATREVLEQGATGKQEIEGHDSAYMFLANAFYDFHVLETPFVPYIGGGLGLVVLTVEVEAAESALDGELLLEDTDTAFAYHFSTGVGYDFENGIGGRPMTLTFDYRYFGSTDPEFETERGEDVKAEFSGHYFGVGVRIKL